MNTFRALRGGAVVIVLSRLVAGGGVATMAGAMALSELVVTPSGSLTNNKSVVVKGTGFKANDQTYITEYLRTAKGGAQCDTATALLVNVSAKVATPATKFKVITGLVGTAKCAPLQRI